MGSTVDQHGTRQRTDPFEDFYQFNGTQVRQFPVTKQKPLDLARQLAMLAQQFSSLLPESSVRVPSLKSSCLVDSRGKAAVIRGQMIALQEELDWQCYQLYGLLSDTLSKTELHDAFAKGWTIESIQPVQVEVRPDLKELTFSDGGPKAWFAVARRNCPQGQSLEEV